jgi:aldose 1-epimerase
MRPVFKRRMTSSAVRIGAVAGIAIAAAGSVAMRQAPVGGHGCSPTVSKALFGSAVEPYTGNNTQVFRYTLTNCRGMQVKIITFGAIQQSITVPGRNGHRADVILGFKTLKDYVAEDSPAPPAGGGPYFGETVGRYANRIAKGTFTLGGVTYHLPINNNGNSLHGGFVGFGNHIWAATEVHRRGAAGVAMTLHSPNGDQGYPGALTLTVTFTLNNAGSLKMQYHATVTGKATVINFTNHNYFNLAGEASGQAYKQQVQINSKAYSPTDATQIPLPLTNGVPVAGTPFDFRAPHTIGSRIADVAAPDNTPASFSTQTGGKSQLLIGQGYDHNWILNKQTRVTTGPNGLNLAAHAWDPRSGRELSVWTDQPGVQFYSGNFLNGTLTGSISGHTYRQGDGYTFETQHFPDSPNEPSFPSTVLNPGTPFNSTTIYQFSS